MIGALRTESAPTLRFEAYVDLRRWDTRKPLSSDELAVLAALERPRNATRDPRIERLWGPLVALHDAVKIGNAAQWGLGVRDMLRAVAAAGKPYWSWSDEQWRAVALEFKRTCVPTVCAILLAPSGLFSLDAPQSAGTHFFKIAQGLFGDDYETLHASVVETIRGLGAELDNRISRFAVRAAVAKLVLACGTTRIADGHAPVLEHLAVHYSGKQNRYGFYALWKALYVLGAFTQRYPQVYGAKRIRRGETTSWEPEIASWLAVQCRYSGKSVERESSQVRCIARWFAKRAPEIVSPSELNLDAILKFRAAVLSGRKNTFSQHQLGVKDAMQALAPRSKMRLLKAMRNFLLDLVEFGHAPKSVLVLAHELETPRNLKTQVKYDPRVIEDAAYAKIITAALDLRPEDVAHLLYPFEFVKALALVWAFGGMRNDEICRLDDACIEDREVPGNDPDGPEDERIYWLRVPANKYKAEFVKPVCREIRDAVEAWISARPPIAYRALDRKTGQYVRPLFSYRGKQVGEKYLNKVVVPILLGKAGLEGYRDRHGGISVHRMRSTIATHLGTGPNAMTLVALRDWLGHRDVGSVQAYLATTPVRLGEEYRRAHRVGVNVYIDLDAVQDGAGDGPWRFTEVAGGMCSHAPFAACPNNMACRQSGCEHHVPEGSALAKRLRAGERAQRLVEEISIAPQVIVPRPKRRKDSG